MTELLVADFATKALDLQVKGSDVFVQASPRTEFLITVPADKLLYF